MSFGIMGGIRKGVWNALKMGPKAFKSGDKKQDGGEYVSSTHWANIDSYLVRGISVLGDIG
jgi:hypothetical protein